jgi:hypothetical protein
MIDLMYSFNHGFIINVLQLFFKLKKIFHLITILSNKKCICLSYFLSNSKKELLVDLKSRKLSSLKNCYILLIDKFYGFLSNFKLFIKYRKNYLTKNTNYRSFRYPSVVFISKEVPKSYINFFRVFVRLRIISIKSMLYLGDIKTINYFLMVGNCLVVYKLLKSIFLLNNLKFSF